MTADEHPDSTVDVYITTPDKKEILIDITTVGNNKKSFRVIKAKDTQMDCNETESG